MKISVIVSTYNRYKTLSEALLSLCQLKYDESYNYEIIIVDNNSNDKTKEIVESFIKQNPRIEYIFESQQGKSNAMNAGIKAASGEILAFTDDDVIIDKNWLLNIAHFANECDFDAVGGKVLPLYPSKTPQWVKDCKDILSGPIVCHDYGDSIKEYSDNMLPFIGANMVIKRKLFEELGSFNPNIGAGKGSTGEDTEYFRRLEKVHKKIFYNPNFLISHPVDTNRTNLKYIAQWNISYGKYQVIKNKGKEDKNLIFILGIPRYLFREMINYTWTVLTSITNKRRFIEAWNGLFCRVGMIAAYKKNE